MTVLGLETTTAVCSVGLVTGQRSVVRTIREDRVHSEKLLTLVDAVIKEAGVTLASLDGVAVSGGPGSFTGLRIGVSAAKGLVGALQRPLMSVPTLQAAATAARTQGCLLAGGWLVLDARQGEWYAARCEGNGKVGDVAIVTTSEILERCRGTEVLTDRPDVFQGQSVTSDLLEYLRGDVVAALGRERLVLGELVDVTSFEPLYGKAFSVRTSPSRGR